MMPTLELSTCDRCGWRIVISPAYLDGKCPPARKATITFHPLPTRTEAGTKPPTELPETPSSISVCYHYDSGDVETLPDSRHEEATGRELIAVLRQLQPEVGRFLAKRHGVIRQLYRSSTKQRTARLPTLKPGRNDPCPVAAVRNSRGVAGVISAVKWPAA
jgi:hypothetical protein